MRGHDQSPARNDPDYIVRPPRDVQPSVRDSLLLGDILHECDLLAAMFRKAEGEKYPENSWSTFGYAYEEFSNKVEKLRSSAPPAVVDTDETTDSPEKYTAATFKGDIETVCKSIAKHLNVREVDPWFQGIVAAIDRTSAVWTLSKGAPSDYLATVEGNPMFPTPPAIRKAKAFSLALALAFLDWLEQREQD